MKKIFSLLIALTLIISMFAVTAVAFAEETEGKETPAETPHATVTFDEDYFKTQIDDNLQIADQKEFAGWLTTSEQLKLAFPGLNLQFKGDKDADGNELFKDTEKYDTVELQVCTDTTKYDEHWNSYTVTKDGAKAKLSTIGWTAFRYVAKYKVLSTDTEYTEVTSTVVERQVIDATRPEADLNSTQSKRVEDGLKVGETYSISTGLTITDSSSTTVTYVIQKYINKEWKQVYSSKDGIEEWYKEEEHKDIGNGSITPTEQDVSTEPIYKIIYTVVDAYGYEATEKVEMALKVIPQISLDSTTEEVEPNNENKVLKIVLYVVAGLSAVGIIVLLVIKPKKQEETRVVYTQNDDSSK